MRYLYRYTICEKRWCFMSVMVKKHVNLPIGLDSLLKKYIESGCFASEAEAIRTAVTLLFAGQQRISPMADYRLLNEISKYIAVANERTQEYQLVPAIEQLKIASDIITLRMSIALVNDEDEAFIDSIRALNIVFVDCLSALRKLAGETCSETELEKAFKEFELIENLNFLTEAYKGLADAKKKEAKTAVTRAKRSSDYLLQPQ
jgi:Arc/MetJ-type ribon-helix-helix transcriptional regulator